MLVVYGDSITSGVSGLKPGELGFAPLVADRLSVELVDRSYGGSRINDAEQMGRILTEPIPEGAVVLFLTGFNDMRWRGAHEVKYYRANLYKALEHLASLAPVLVGNCLKMLPAEYANPVHQEFVHGSDADVKVFNSAIAEVVAELRWRGLPLYPVEVTRHFDVFKHVSYDGVHPNPEGHRVLADQFLKWFRSSGGEERSTNERAPFRSERPPTNVKSPSGFAKEQSIALPSIPKALR